jgi:hypothetical protein
MLLMSREAFKELCFVFFIVMLAVAATAPLG